MKKLAFCAAISLANACSGGTQPTDGGANDTHLLDAGTRDGTVDAMDAMDAMDAIADTRVLDAARDASVRDALPDAPPDAGPLGDSLPTDAVMFFTQGPCPAGWTPFTEGDGRFAVPALIGGGGIETHGTPLASGEDRTHTHGVSATFALRDVSYAGLTGGGNHGVAQSGNATLTTTSAPASTGLPYVQLLACRKTTAMAPRAATLPTGMLMYYAGSACPSGFLQASVTEGRFLVGLAAGAPNATPFGGTQIDATHPITHAHANTPQLTTSPHGIGLASGCCGSGFAADDTYSAPTPTESTDPGLPTVHLLQCQKL